MWQEDTIVLNDYANAIFIQNRNNIRIEGYKGIVNLDGQNITQKRAFNILNSQNIIISKIVIKNFPVNYHKKNVYGQGIVVGGDPEQYNDNNTILYLNNVVLENLTRVLTIQSKTGKVFFKNCLFKELKFIPFFVYTNSNVEISNSIFIESV